MEMSQGNPLHSYLKQTNKNVILFFYKIGELVGKTGPVKGFGTSGGGRM
jgi:hypothetical protein